MRSSTSTNLSLKPSTRSCASSLASGTRPTRSCATWLVASVLREELNVPDGLADPNVYILDPCCGTGSYLIEALDRIAVTLRAKGGDALTAQEIKRAVMTRVFGFEILPAPFVVTHLQISLLLQSLGAPFSETRKERAAVYLTNALTGWEPPDGSKPQMLLGFPELLLSSAAISRPSSAELDVDTALTGVTRGKIRAERAKD